MSWHNKGVHQTAMPLHSIAAGDVWRSALLDEQFEKVADHLPLAIAKSGEIPAQVTKALFGRRIVVHFPVAGVATVERVEHAPIVFVGGNIIYFGGGMITMPFSMRAVADLVLVAPAEALDKARIEAHALSRRRENGTVEIVLKRTFVGSGTLLIGIAPAVLEKQVPDNEPERRGWKGRGRSGIPIDPR
jgi:hypothetical protein